MIKTIAMHAWNCEEVQEWPEKIQNVVHCKKKKMAVTEENCSENTPSFKSLSECF